MNPSALVVALAIGLSTVVAQPDRIAAEISRLREDVPKVLPESSRAAVLSRLERGAKAVVDGDTYLALYDLQVAFESEAGYRLAAEQRKHPDQDAFQRLWAAMGAPPEPSGRRADTLFVEALAQSAEGRAPATYRASLPYAQDAGLAAGLYYLGEAHAMVRFAALCRAVKLDSAGPGPGLPSIEPALARYEAEVVKAYDQADAPQRPQYAGVHVAIKLARTLDEQGRREGALLQYLVSRHRYGLIGAAARPAPSATGLEERLKDTRLPPGSDHSIAAFFLQLAAAAMSGPEPLPQAAAVVLDDVLPAYFSVVKR
jgi:hypothetical protein